MRKIRECVGRLHNLCRIRTRGTRIAHIRSDRALDLNVSLCIFKDLRCRPAFSAGLVPLHLQGVAANIWFPSSRRTHKSGVSSSTPRRAFDH